MTTATYTAEEFFGLLGVSNWAGYESVRRGDCPIPPIKVGRRLVWPRASVDRLLGIDQSAKDSEARGTTPGTNARTTHTLLSATVTPPKEVRRCGHAT